MGWTSYQASHYKNGQVDRKAECDDYITTGLNRGFYELIKSSMKGSIYYAAVRDLKKYVGKNANGKSVYVDIPKEQQQIIPIILLTGVDSKDYYNFSYKEVGLGCYNDCPTGILKLLTPTDEINKWIEDCNKYKEAEKAFNKIYNLPVGSEIEITYQYDTTQVKAGETKKAVKAYIDFYNTKSEWVSTANGVDYYTPKRMLKLQKLKVIKEVK